MRAARSKWGPVLAIGVTAVMAAFVVGRRPPADPPAAPAAPPSIAELAEQLGDSSVELRRDASLRLSQAGPAAIVALRPLLDALSDVDPLTRAHASVALGRIGPAALERLMEATGHPDPRVRRGALYALRLLGPGAVPAISQIVAALRDADNRVRFAAADALVRIGPAAQPALLAELRTGPPQSRADAVEVLSQIGPRPDAAPSLLAAALDDPDANVRANAARALADVVPSVGGRTGQTAVQS